MKYAIYGAGSLGTVLGAYISKSGIDIDLINRNKEHVKALNEKGAHIKGTVDFTVKVKAMTPDQMKDKYDIIFLMTKQLLNNEVVTFLKDYLTEKGVIVTLQNGIPEPGIADIIGKKRTIGCVVEWGATLSAPGESTLTSDQQSLSFHMGKMDGVDQSMFDLAKSLLEKMCPVYYEDNLIGCRWSKLLINATFSGIGTCIGGLFGDVSEDKNAQKVAIRCMKECIDVGHGANAVFAKVQGKDITKLFYYKSKIKRTFAIALLPIAMKKHRLIEPSMLQDLKKNKPCEVNAINGVVCQWGKIVNVKTPINDRIVEIITAIQDKKLALSKDNIHLFDDLIKD